MDQFHNQLLENNSSYQKWHEHKSHKLAHFLIFLIIVILAAVSLLITIQKSDLNASAPLNPHRPFASLKFETRMNGKSELAGDEAIAALGSDISQVARYYRLDEKELKHGLKNDKSLRLSKDGLLFHVDEIEIPQGATPGDGTIPNNPTPNEIPDSQTFLLHSRPNATARIYLDFNGDSGRYSAWNGGQTINSAPYNLGTDPDTSANFSAAELQEIKNIWKAVAEDYAPFNVDVTTEDSTPPNRSQFIKVIITPTNAWRPGVGGIAFVGSFTWGDGTPVFVFSSALGNGTAKYNAEASSHEAGHSLGLSHSVLYNTSCGIVESYYLGTGGPNNPNGWSSIMGNSYYKGVTQWLNHNEIPLVATQYGCSNKQNQPVLITTQNGFGFTTDEAGNTLNTAQNLMSTTTSSGNNVDVAGVITQNDTDIYKFTTAGGNILLNVNPMVPLIIPGSPSLSVLGNADFKVRLLNSNSVVLSESNPTGVAPVTISIADVPSGTYYLEISASNYLDFTQTGGYSVSGSMGKYNIVGSYSVSEDIISPTITLTSPVNGSTISNPVNLAANASDNVGISKVEFYWLGELIGEDTTAPYSYSYNNPAMDSTTSGNYWFYAKAYDVSGNQTQSQTVSVAVLPTGGPSVSIYSPINGATVQGTIDIGANASASGGITKVEFYRGTTLVATDTTSPYLAPFDTRTVSNGSYTFSAKAYGTSGMTSTSTTTVTINNDLVAPTVTITAPTAGPVSGQVSITATASDNVGVDHVDFYAGGVEIGGDYSAPYGVTWDTTLVSTGTYTITAIAYDVAENSGQAAPVTVSVAQGCTSNCDTEMPTVYISTHTNGETVFGDVTLGANAYDANGVARVSFYRGTTLIDTDTTAGYAVAWDTTTLPNGTYNIRAEAYDPSENKGVSETISLIVNNVPDTAPSISISSPIPGQNVSGSVPINATATDDKGVTQVAFYYGDSQTHISTDTTAPYSANWNTSGLAGGQYILIATATDTVGHTAAASVSVNLASGPDTIAPTANIISPTNGTRLRGANVNIKTTSSDNMRVTKMELYMDSTLIATSTPNVQSATFNYSHNIKTLAAGAHIITLKTYDAAGNIGEKSVSVTK